MQESQVRLCLLKKRLCIFSVMLFGALLQPGIAQTQDCMPLNTVTTTLSQDLRTSLLNLSDTTKQLKKALHEVINEVQRHETIIVSDPYFDDPYLYNYNAAWNLTYPIPDDAIYSYNNGPVLPPRPKWMQHFMSQVLSLLQILQQETSSIESSPGLRPSWQAQLEVINDTVDTLTKQSQELQILTQAKDMNNDRIAIKAKQMSDNLSGLDNIGKQLISEVKNSV